MLSPAQGSGPYWIGVDVGGTFADYVIYDAENGALLAYKAPAPRSTRAEAVLDGLRKALVHHGIAGAKVVFFGHGTTVATNALLTREAPAIGAVTTKGFGDLLEIRRQTRRDVFDYYADFPPPLVARPDVLEVNERIDAFGTVLVQLDLQQTELQIEAIARQGVTSLAVCLLHSYANAAHEQALAELAARKFPDLLISISSDLVPEFREYERMSTTVLNAYVRPVVTSYLTRFERGLSELGITAPLGMVQSNGGIVSSKTASRQPVGLLRSGPAAGVAGAFHVARQAGENRIITLDIGGTSADVSILDGAAPALMRDWEVNTHPVKWPAIDVRSIGAGGGSIAWVDGSGLLKVGPASAGSDPGPACYGRGGGTATVTDAQVVLGRIAGDAILGNTLRLEGNRARDAIAALAAALGRDESDAAAGIIEIVNAAIAQEIHFICAEKGLNLRDFTLMAFGGGGPLHASHVARELGIGKVLVPYWPGLLCALGVLTTQPKADFSATRLISLDPADALQPREIDALFAALDERAAAWMAEQKIPMRGVERRRSLAIRYRGQNYELQVDIDGGLVRIDEIIERFHRRHEVTYGYRSPRGIVQMVNARLAIALDTDRPPFRPQGAVSAKSGPKGERSVYLGREHGFMSCPVYDRDAMPRGMRFRGPAVIEQMDTTTLVLPFQDGHIDDWSNILLVTEGR